MTLNLDADIAGQVECLNSSRWTPLQAETCMYVANAKYYAFQDEADRHAEFVRCGLETRAEAVEILHAAALYNGLYCEYGRDKIQGVVAEALRKVAAA